MVGSDYDVKTFNGCLEAQRGSVSLCELLHCPEMPQAWTNSPSLVCCERDLQEGTKHIQLTHKASHKLSTDNVTLILTDL